MPQTIRVLASEAMEQPPYGPDLAPTDFHMCGPLKEELRGRSLPTDEDVIDAVQNWLNLLLQNFFLTESKKLVKR
jgi:hypothetical protein